MSNYSPVHGGSSLLNGVCTKSSYVGHLALLQPDAVTPAQCGLLIKMVPEREGHSVELQWPTVSEQDHYRAGPSHYISHLLG
jgi:secreted Zn-dependent insulinase-like peptidase